MTDIVTLEPRNTEALLPVDKDSIDFLLVFNRVAKLLPVSFDITRNSRRVNFCIMKFSLRGMCGHFLYILG